MVIGNIYDHPFILVVKYNPTICIFSSTTILYNSKTMVIGNISDHPFILVVKYNPTICISSSATILYNSKYAFICLYTFKGKREFK